MIVIGIDPGIATTGYGVVKKEEDSFCCLAYGVIKTSKKDATPARLGVLDKKISSLIKKYSPDLLAVENLYFFKNVKSAFPVSQAKGAILLIAENSKISVCEFTPLEVKTVVTGYGKADKNQVQEMIRITLNLEEKPHPADAADALGVALCGIIKETSPY